MTGGQLQVLEEAKIAGHVHSRLESLLRGTKTDECREEIITAYRNYMGAMALVSVGPREGISSAPQPRWPVEMPPLLSVPQFVVEGSLAPRYSRMGLQGLRSCPSPEV